MESVIQSELDIAEEYILSKLFGDIYNIKLGLVVNTVLNLKGVNLHNLINQKILEFENKIKPYMTETGYIDGNKLTETLTNKFVILKGCITFPTLKPIEYAKILDEMIGIEAIGMLLKNL